MWTLTTDIATPMWLTAATPSDAVLASSTRKGGISAPPYHALNLGRSTADRPEAVTENRKRMLEALGLSPESLATAGQVHGARVVRVESPGHVPECDALVTVRPGLALAITTADCMSLLFHAPGAVAAAHSGWRGTAGRMPEIALAAIREAAGCDPGQIRVYLGPCIRSCCYEVGEDVARAFPDRVVKPGSPRPHLDLPLAARMQLEAAGVLNEHIMDCGACTACEPEWYFSHRRDGPLSGRHWSIAALTGS